MELFRVLVEKELDLLDPSTNGGQDWIPARVLFAFLEDIPRSLALGFVAHLFTRYRFTRYLYSMCTQQCCLYSPVASRFKQSAEFVSGK